MGIAIFTLVAQTKPDSGYSDNTNLFTNNSVSPNNENSAPITDNKEINPFLSLTELIEFLNINMFGPTIVMLDSGIYEIDETLIIDFPYLLTFQGHSSNGTIINATSKVSGHPLFNCKTESCFKQITFNAISNSTGNDAIVLENNDKINEVSKCNFTGFNKAILLKNSQELWVNESEFTDCKGAGIELTDINNMSKYYIFNCHFVQCNKGINQIPVKSENTIILNCSFDNKPTVTEQPTASFTEY